MMNPQVGTCRQHNPKLERIRDIHHTRIYIPISGSKYKRYMVREIEPPCDCQPRPLYSSYLIDISHSASLLHKLTKQYCSTN